MQCVINVKYSRLFPNITNLAGIGETDNTIFIFFFIYKPRESLDFYIPMQLHLYVLLYHTATLKQQQ